MFYGIIHTSDLVDIVRSRVDIVQSRVEVFVELRTAVKALGLKTTEHRACGSGQFFNRAGHLLPPCTALDTACVSLQETLSLATSLAEIV